MMPTLDPRLEFARKIARQGGQLTLQYFQNRELDVERKGDQSPVTVADRECEQNLRAEIQANYPDDTVLGEEFGVTEGNSEYRWILDPIDGTKSFICGVPLYGTMIGIEKAGKPFAGVVYIPGLDEMMFAAKGHGCWRQVGDKRPEQASVSNVDAFQDAKIVTSEVETFNDRNALQSYLQLESNAYFARTWGDCYGYLLVASGRVDMMLDPVLNIWDAAAVEPIITEAGGTFTDWTGVEAIDSGHAVASNGKLHAAALNVLRNHVTPS